MNKNSTGDCYICGANLSKSTIKNHILKNHQESRSEQECYLLKIENSYLKNYWLYIDIPVNKTLSDVDKFLRKIWLECCGHLSMFYSSASPEKRKFQSGRIEFHKNTKLNYFEIGKKFFHMYDFGTTTETDITVIERIWRKQQKTSVRLLARNTPPVFKCEDCEEEAEFLCRTNESYEELYYCAECTDGVSQCEDYLEVHPITNSPRMGCCGYDGELDTFTFDPKNV